MKRLYAFLIAAALCFPSIGAMAWWQSIQQVGVGAAPTYQGPGDVDSGWAGWYSCARAFTAAYAAGTANLCDLVDSAAPTVVICTLKAGANGLVDLVSASCTGGVTPSVKCAAATGATCNVSKAYDQIGTVGDCTNATAATQPTLTFAAFNSLPSMTSVAANSTVLTCGTVTQSQPFSFSAVYVRTGSPTTISNFIGASGAFVLLGGSASSGFATIYSGSPNINIAAAENALHAVQGLSNGTSSALNVDGSDNIPGLTAGVFTMSGNIRLLRSNGGASVDGKLMEAGFKASATTATNRGNLSTNQHGTNGYNF